MPNDAADKQWVLTTASCEAARGCIHDFLSSLALEKMEHLPDSSAVIVLGVAMAAVIEAGALSHAVFGTLPEMWERQVIDFLRGALRGAGCQVDEFGRIAKDKPDA
jgi:hypothetical protein